MCFELVTHFFMGDRIVAIANKINDLFLKLKQAHYAYEDVERGEPQERITGFFDWEERRDVPFGYGARVQETTYRTVPRYEIYDYIKPDEATLSRAKKLEEKKIAECRQGIIVEYKKLRAAFCDTYYGKAIEEIPLRHRNAFSFMIYVTENINNLSSTTSYETLKKAQTYLDNNLAENKLFEQQCEEIWSDLQQDYFNMHFPNAV
ncbi:MAG: hypothetical protein Q8M03_13390 [Legionella sp.]|nr:hypothetical protein [Legionella sp.]